MKLYTHLTLFALFIFLVQGPLKAQKDPYPDWENFPIGKRVLAFAESDSFVWAGMAKSGMIRINKETGDRTFYNSANSRLPGNQVTAIEIDADGTKWIGTSRNGIAKVKNNEWEFINARNSTLRSNNINCLTRDNEGHLWAGGENLFHIRGQSNRVYVGNQTDQEIRGIREIVVDDSANKWLVTYDGMLAKFRNGNWQVYTESNSGIPLSMVNAVAVDSQNHLWLGGRGAGLVEYDGQNWENHDEPHGIEDEEVSSIAIDSAGKKWIGLYNNGPIITNNGVMSYQDGNLERNHRGFGAQSVFSIFKDEEGVPWFGTASNAIKRREKSGWKTYKTTNSDLKNKVNDVAFPDSGEKWVATQSGFFHYDSAAWNKGLPNDLNFNGQAIRRMTIDDNGHIWFVTDYRDLYRYNGSELKSFDPWEKGLFNLSKVNDMKIGPDGGLWLATDVGGVAKWKNKEWTFYNSDNSELPDNKVRDMAIGQSGRLWFATSKGLAEFDGQRWEVFQQSNSPIPHNLVSSIDVDPWGAIWVGTGYGLAQKYGNDWKVYRTSDTGLPDNLISDVAVDENGRVWIGTNDGLTVFNGRQWKTYQTENSGLASNEVGRIKIDSSGNKWIYKDHRLLIPANSARDYGRGVTVFRDTGIARGKEPEPESDADLKFGVFPNPAQKWVEIRFKSNVEAAQYQLLTSRAKLAKSGQVQQMPNNRIWVESLAPGLYLLKVHLNDTTKVRKLVVY